MSHYVPSFFTKPLGEIAQDQAQVRGIRHRDARGHRVASIYTRLGDSAAGAQHRNVTAAATTAALLQHQQQREQHAEGARLASLPRDARQRLSAGYSAFPSTLTHTQESRQRAENFQQQSLQRRKQQQQQQQQQQETSRRAALGVKGRSSENWHAILHKIDVEGETPALKAKLKELDPVRFAKWLGPLKITPRRRSRFNIPSPSLITQAERERNEQQRRTSMKKKQREEYKRWRDKKNAEIQGQKPYHEIVAGSESSKKSKKKSKKTRRRGTYVEHLLSMSNPHLGGDAGAEDFDVHSISPKTTKRKGGRKRSRKRRKRRRRTRRVKYRRKRRRTKRRRRNSRK